VRLFGVQDGSDDEGMLSNCWPDYVIRP